MELVSLQDDLLVRICDCLPMRDRLRLLRVCKRLSALALSSGVLLLDCPSLAGRSMQHLSELMLLLRHSAPELYSLHLTSAVCASISTPADTSPEQLLAALQVLPAPAALRDLRLVRPPPVWVSARDPSWTGAALNPDQAARLRALLPALAAGSLRVRCAPHELAQLAAAFGRGTDLHAELVQPTSVALPGDEALAELLDGALPSLRSLICAEILFTGRLRAVAALVASPQLQRLELEGGAAEPGVMLALAASLRGSRLQALALVVGSGGDVVARNAALAALLRQVPSSGLTALGLTAGRLLPAAVLALAEALPQSRLERLDLSDLHIGEDPLDDFPLAVHLAAALTDGRAALRSLKLEGTVMSDVAYQALFTNLPATAIKSLWVTPDELSVSAIADTSLFDSQLTQLHLPCPLAPSFAPFPLGSPSSLILNLLQRCQLTVLDLSGLVADDAALVALTAALRADSTQLSSLTILVRQPISTAVGMSLTLSPGSHTLRDLGEAARAARVRLRVIDGRPGIDDGGREGWLS